MSDGFSDTEDGREAQAHVWTGEQVGGREHNCRNVGFVGRGTLVHNPPPPGEGVPGPGGVGPTGCTIGLG